MARLPGNSQLTADDGRRLYSLRDINLLAQAERDLIYGQLLPERLFTQFGINRTTWSGVDGSRCIDCIAPEGLGLLRLEVRRSAADSDPLFFLDLADTQFHQMELAFCIISDPESPRFAVDRDMAGHTNYFASMGRNIPEELRAMAAGLYPNQTRRGLRMFGEFFPRFERFVDSLGIDMIVAEPLTYDNAIRYEGYGFDYLRGKRLMLQIDAGFQPRGTLANRLDGSTPFRLPEQAGSVRGRSWAIHDGIMDEPWDDVQIYKIIGVHAGISTIPSNLSDAR
jgi:hypothetical protein